MVKNSLILTKNRIDNKKRFTNLKITQIRNAIKKHITVDVFL